MARLFFKIDNDVVKVCLEPVAVFVSIAGSICIGNDRAVLDFLENFFVLFDGEVCESPGCGGKTGCVFGCAEVLCLTCKFGIPFAAVELSKYDINGGRVP